MLIMLYVITCSSFMLGSLQPPAGNSWLGSLIATIIGNLKVSISNVHIRYEDSTRFVAVCLFVYFPVLILQPYLSFVFFSNVIVFGVLETTQKYLLINFFLVSTIFAPVIQGIPLLRASPWPASQLLQCMRKEMRHLTQVVLWIKCV